MNKEAKWGISYNTFDDAIELLPYSINSIRESVDFITVVLQSISNHGRKAETDILATVRQMKEAGLIDNYYFYSPTSVVPHFNEVQKRNIGKRICEENKCTHYMSMDCDELYIKEEFENMKKIMADGNYESGACQMLTYYKTSEYILDPPEEYYVPLFYKIEKNKNFVLGGYYPVLVDPSRRIPSSNVRLFTREEIQMHHFSYLRNDIRKKLVNSSAYGNYAHNLENIIKDYDEFDGTKANIAGGIHKVKKINPIFNINL